MGADFVKGASLLSLYGEQVQPLFFAQGTFQNVDVKWCILPNYE